MDAATGVFEAILKLGLPVGLISFLVVGWSLHKGVLSERQGVKALRKEIDALAKTRKKQKKDKAQQDPPRLNPVQEKWLKFGGGFYGIVALYTYGLIEFHEIRETIASFGGVGPFFEALGIRLLINMFIEGILNFVAAISWPVYWMSEFGGRMTWVLFVVAYAAYWLGMKLAQKTLENPSSGN